MDTSRLDILRQLVEKNPKDLFTLYGLAMEHARLEEYDKALETFRKLWEINPDYAAAYQQAGQLLAKIGQTEEARHVFEKGIEAAGRSANFHAKSEMEAALTELESHR